MTTPDLHEGKGLVLSSFEPGFRTSVGVVKATLIAASIATAAVAAPVLLMPSHAHAAASNAIQSLDSLDAAIRALGDASQLSAAASAGTLSPEAESLSAAPASMVLPSTAIVPMRTKSFSRGLWETCRRCATT